MYGAEIETLGKVDHKYPVSFEMWWCRRTGKISWTDRVRNEEVLHRVKEERNKVGKLDWSHLTGELLSEICY